jgi:hypothetical protein
MSGRSWVCSTRDCVQALHSLPDGPEKDERSAKMSPQDMGERNIAPMVCSTCSGGDAHVGVKSWDIQV